MITHPAGRGGAAVEKTARSMPSSSRWRVVIVDDSLVLRCGLRLAFEADRKLVVVGEAVNGLDGVSLVRELRPDGVVMDFNMPIMDGVEATRKIKAEAPETVVIGYSLCGLQDRTRLMEAGADEFVQKSDPVSVLIEAVRHSLGAHDVANTGVRV